MFSAASFIWDFPILEKIRENMELIVPIVVLVILFCFDAGLFIGTIIFRKRKKETCLQMPNHLSSMDIVK